jgi:hypothetical protein
MEHVNKIAEKENSKMRFTTLFELRRISTECRQDLDKLVLNAWGVKPFGKQQEQ